MHIKTYFLKYTSINCVTTNTTSIYYIWKYFLRWMMLLHVFRNLNFSCNNWEQNKFLPNLFSLHQQIFHIDPQQDKLLRSRNNESEMSCFLCRSDLKHWAVRKVLHNKIIAFVWKCYMNFIISTNYDYTFIQILYMPLWNPAKLIDSGTSKINSNGGFATDKNCFTNVLLESCFVIDFWFHNRNTTKNGHRH